MSNSGKQRLCRLGHLPLLTEGVSDSQGEESKGQLSKTKVILTSNQTASSCCSCMLSSSGIFHLLSLEQRGRGLGTPQPVHLPPVLPEQEWL